MCRDSFLLGLLQEEACGSRALASWHSIGLAVPVVVVVVVVPLARSTDALSGIVAVTLSRDDFRDCNVRAQEATSCRCGCDTSMDGGGGGGAARTMCRGGGGDGGDEVGEQWSVVASVGAHDAVSECAVWVLLLRPSNKFNELVVVCNGCCCDGCSGCACDGWSDEVKEARRELRLADFSLPSRLISRLLPAVEELLDFRGVVDLEPVFLVLRTDFVSDCCCCTCLVAIRNVVSASSLLVCVVVHVVVAVTGAPVESGSTVTASRTRRLVGEADSGAPCPLLPPLSNNRAARADVQAMPVKKLLLPSAPCSIFLAILLSKAAKAEPILPFFMLKNQLTDYSPFLVQRINLAKSQLSAPSPCRERGDSWR
jgi:hypothetical protein